MRMWRVFSIDSVKLGGGRMMQRVGHDEVEIPKKRTANATRCRTRESYSGPQVFMGLCDVEFYDANPYLASIRCLGLMFANLKE